MSTFTLPGLSPEGGANIAQLLQQRLNAYTDLHLTLKHVHWNLVGPNFIGVHEMLDTQVDTVRGYADEVAERVAALGYPPIGTPGAIVAGRRWDDYSIGRDTVQAHLAALDVVYTGLIRDNRTVIEDLGKLDPMTEDLVIGQTRGLEQFQWFLRAHLENPAGARPHSDSDPEWAAAREART